MATTPPNDPHRTTVSHDPAVRPGYTDPAARPAHDPAYREPVTTEDRSSGGLGKWVMIALAALAVALLVSFFVGPDSDVEVAEDGVVIENEDPAVAVVEEPVIETEGDVAVVEEPVVQTDEPIVENAETVPLGEEVTGTEETETAVAPVEETPATEATETAVTPLTEENPGTDATETGSIAVEPADGEAPAAEGELEFREVEVQTAN